MKNGKVLEELLISKIIVNSGIRPMGRMTDFSKSGRKNNGFLYVWEGEATFYCNDGKTIVVKNGQTAYIPKNEKYSMKYTAFSTTFVVVNFDLNKANGDDFRLFDEITVLTNDDKDNRIAKIMTALELCGALKTIGALFRKKEMLYKLLGLLYSQFPEWSEDGADRRISQGVRLLKQTYLENLPISDFADASHVSVNSFRTLFKKQFEVSPVKYRNRLRIERAKELLREGDLTVTEVAYACGFENIGYFCRYYRQITGESPSDTKIND